MSHPGSLSVASHQNPNPTPIPRLFRPVMPKYGLRSWSKVNHSPSCSSAMFQTPGYTLSARNRFVAWSRSRLARSVLS